MFERYSDRAKRAVRLAQEEAADLGHDAVGTDHLLLGLIGEGGGVAFTALSGLGVTAQAASGAVCRHHKAGTRRTEGHLPWTPQFRKVTELALRESLLLGNNFIGTEHLLLGLIREGSDVGALALADCGIAEGDRGFSSEVRAKVLELLHGYAEAERSARPAAPAPAGQVARQQAFAWELVIRMREYLGHIEDMSGDERLFMLGALTGALEGMLRDAGVPEPLEIGRS